MKVIVDLDGSLSVDDERRSKVNVVDEAGEQVYKDYEGYHSACEDDPPNWPLVEIVMLMLDAGHHVEIWTGRPDTYETQTRRWLSKTLGFRADYIPLRMRRENDNRSTNVVKGEWLAECGWTPDLVFDDRAKCVDFWREQGITCFQVADHT